MANITLNQLISTNDELTQNESSAIIGGNFIKTVAELTAVTEGFTAIGKGFISIHNGLNALKGGKAPKSGGASNSAQILAYQEFFAPDTIAGV